MPLRVIIVEDNLIARELLKEMIEALGHQVVAEAEDLATTVAAYKQHKPDVLTIDLSLPTGDGLAILKALRRTDPKARAIIISGNSQARIREEVLKAGAANFLAKPIDLAALRACLCKLFPHADNA